MIEPGKPIGDYNLDPPDPGPEIDSYICQGVFDGDTEYVEAIAILLRNWCERFVDDCRLVHGTDIDKDELRAYFWDLVSESLSEWRDSK